MKRIYLVAAVFTFILVFGLSVFGAVSIDGLLTTQVKASPLSLTPVVITFDHRVGNSDFLMLQSLGIKGGRYLSQLPIVLTSVNKTQFSALKTNAGIKSLYANHTFQKFDFQSRTISGVEALVRDSQVTAVNQGLPVSGKNIGIAYVDTGIDATHPDLQLCQNLIHNEYFSTADIPQDPTAIFLQTMRIDHIHNTV